MVRDRRPTAEAFTQRWSGPLTIERKISNEVYQIIKDGMLYSFHIDDLRKAPRGNPQVAEEDESGSSSSGDSAEEELSSPEASDGEEDEVGGAREHPIAELAAEDRDDRRDGRQGPARAQDKVSPPPTRLGTERKKDTVVPIAGTSHSFKSTGLSDPSVSLGKTTNRSSQAIPVQGTSSAAGSQGTQPTDQSEQRTGLEPTGLPFIKIGTGRIVPYIPRVRKTTDKSLVKSSEPKDIPNASHKDWRAKPPDTISNKIPGNLQSEHERWVRLAQRRAEVASELEKGVSKEGVEFKPPLSTPYLTRRGRKVRLVILYPPGGKNDSVNVASTSL